MVRLQFDTSPSAISTSCVLVTPSPSTVRWVEAVREVVLNAGLQRTVLVTSDVDEALYFGAHHWAVILPEFGSTDDVAVLGNRARDISRALARAADSPGSFAVFDGPALVGKDAVAIVPGVTLHMAGFGLDEQAEPGMPASLEIYRHGRPVQGDTADWPLDFLHYSRDVEKNVDGLPEVDISGYTRIFAWGPHIVLSKGEWRVRVRIKVDEAGAKEHLAFDWGSLSSHTRLTACPGVAGLHEAVLDHAWSGEEVAELRIGLDRAAFSGCLTILSMSVERLGPHPAN